MSQGRQAANLDGLGRAIAERQDALRDEAKAKDEARRALFARPSIPGLRPRRWPIWASAAAVVAALVALVITRPWSDASGGVRSGQLVAAATSSEMLRFDDGSEVTVKPGATLRVDRVDSRGADLVLEKGSLFAAIVKRPEARWSFGVGDYLVTVTGTAFDLSWSPPTLSVVMHEGSVIVTGPGLGEGQPVVAGERAVFPPPAAEVAAPESHETAPSDEPATGPEAAPSATSSAAPASTWQARAARGDHEGAFEEVAPRLDRELASLDASSLVRLATVARLSGHPDVARRVYLTLRERFPGTPSAAEAAFSLGTMAFGGNAAEAERWLRLALVEAPGSGLAASARGRLLELAIRRGDAKAAAEDYLRHHPDGPHAALARGTLAP